MKKYQKILLRAVFILFLLGLWELVAIKLAKPAFPAITEVFKYLFEALFQNKQTEIFSSLGTSLLVILEGLGIGVAIAFVCSGLSVASEFFGTIYNLIVSIFDLLPGVALIPVLIVIGGTNDVAILVLVIHSVVWPMSRSIIDGFKSVSKMHIESGKNIGLKHIGLIFGIYIPASFASILSGIKVGWARAWRGLISAEMILSVAGIGRVINNARTFGNYVDVYASLILVIIVGVVVEYGIFANIEKHTIRKWGMTNER